MKELVDFQNSTIALQKQKEMKKERKEEHTYK